MFLGYIHELGIVAGLSGIDLHHIEVACEEAFVNILEHAYPDSQPGDVFIEGDITPTDLIISFRDEGIPFHESPGEFPYALTEDGEAQPHGIGFQIIRNTVDEVRFENLGKRGKMLVLVKRLPTPADPEPVKEIQEPALALPQQYEIRPVRSGDLSQVSRLFWMVYGYSYKNESFYRPEGLLHLNTTGQVISYVAVGEDGQVAGHTGLIRTEPGPMAEIGLLVVSPAHRGRGLMELLNTAVSSRALELGLSGLSYNAVTSHNRSQKGGYKMGFIPCSLDLAACPPRVFKALVSQDLPPQRESYLHMFKYLTDPPAVTIHIPSRHHGMVSRIYQNLQQSYTMGSPEPATLTGDFRIHYDKTMLKGIITVTVADERQWPEILRVADNMAEFAGAEVVNLDLPLAQPSTSLLFEKAESAGFIFTGIRPCQYQDGDCARLQRISVPFDLKHLEMWPGSGESLLKDIRP
jgi:anti-sigma regulatory factor (Ser/Thr protein kinase)/GNAT superfamily N-acetyltransferase